MDLAARCGTGAALSLNTPMLAVHEEGAPSLAADGGFHRLVVEGDPSVSFAFGLGRGCR
jgi:hypothetical protein